MEISSWDGKVRPPPIVSLVHRSMLAWQWINPELSRNIYQGPQTSRWKLSDSVHNISVC